MPTPGADVRLGQILQRRRYRAAQAEVADDVGLPRALHGRLEPAGRAGARVEAIH